MSQLTTHILDTTQGKPAPGIPVTLYQFAEEDWIKIAEGISNTDGRVSDLLAKDVTLGLGIYKLSFETQSYFSGQAVQSFYPFVEIVFEVFNSDHYHVPLLLNPFGYSTYRGS